MHNRKWFAHALLGALGGFSLVIPLLFAIQHFAPAYLLPKSPPSTNPGTGKVQSIVDGDTLVLSIAGQSERVRLVGIDTPESVSPNTPNQCFGAEATQALRGLIAPGDTVQIAADVDRRDRYGRLLLYVYTEDGVFINRWLVDSGFADVMFFEPNTALRPELVAARNQARSAEIGLWSQCDGPDQPLN